MDMSHGSGADARCACGRPRSEARITVYRSLAARFEFHRCPCGDEWTVEQGTADRSQPISSDEVLEVHLRLHRFEGTLTELLGIRQTS